MTNFKLNSGAKKNWLIVFVVFLFGCDGKPPKNTEEYLALHGINPNENVIIEVGGVTVNIPPEFRVFVETYDEIQEGKADIVRIYIRPSEVILGSTPSASFVRIEIMAAGIGKYNRQDWILNEEWQSVTYLKILDMTKYVRPGSSGGFGYVTFYSDKYPSEDQLEDILIACQGDHGEPSGLCKGVVENKNAAIWYFFNANLIGSWKELVFGINSKLSEFIME